MNETRAKDTAALGGQAPDAGPAESGSGTNASARMTMTVRVGDDAQMCVPTELGAWCARYYPQYLQRFDASGVMASYLYLVLECTKAEAWRRIKLMRAALLDGCESGVASPEIGSVPNTAAETEPE
jgi:hypothetical protein